MRKSAIFFLVSAIVSASLLGQGSGPLSGLARLNRAVSKRISSHDRSGGNADAIPIPQGQTLTVADITGPGSIKHIWVTISSESRYHLRELVLRMYWDGETEPSVQAPLGDFFGTGFGAYKSWQSLPLTVQDRALNCYFPMPFSTGARVTITNDGEQPVGRIFYHIDYEQYQDARETADQGRFHAHWRRANPVPAISGDASKGVNRSAENNFTILDAQGRGQFVGIVLNVQGFATGWWGEGDDMFFVDGEPYPPSVHGTGLEDYFNNAWGFQEEFSYPFNGYSLKGNPDWTGSHTMYRFHIQDPIYFTKSLHGSIEHGHANARGDDYSSVAYWYQTEPHKSFEPLPPVKKRLPNRHWKIEPTDRRPPG